MMTSFGETVRALRLERNLTQEQLSGALNISPQAVSKWERGQALPDLTLIPALARALNVTADALFGMDASAREIEALRDRAMALVENNPTESRRILSEGLQKYPAAPALLRALEREGGEIVYSHWTAQFERLPKAPYPLAED